MDLIKEEIDYIDMISKPDIERKIIVKQLTENKIFEEEKYDMKKTNIHNNKADISGYANRIDEPRQNMEINNHHQKKLRKNLQIQTMYRARNKIQSQA